MTINTQVREHLENAKIDILLNFPFYGLLLSKMPLIEVKSIRTMATNYKSIFYNPDFVLSLTHDQRVFALAHEITHCVFGHFTRMGNRERDWWNMATDYEINYALSHMQFTKFDGTKLTSVGKIGPGWLYDVKYTNMVAEEIYEQLEKTQAPKLDPMDQHMIPGAGDTASDTLSDTSLSDTMTGDEIEEMVNLPEVSESDMKKFENEFIQNMFHAEQAVQPGQVPAKIKRQIESLRNPKKDWRVVLRPKIEAAIKPNKTWMNPSRRSWTQGFIMPGPAPEKAIEVAIALDLSGSISKEQGRDLLSETAGIMNQFKQFKVYLWTFDSIVYEDSMVEFDETTGFDLLDFEMHGGGGTDFGRNWQFMKKKAIKPHRFIMFTDGYCHFDRCDPNYVDTIWLVHSNPQFKAPFGLVLEYNDGKKS